MSKSITATYVDGLLNINGRATTLLGKSQGDHVSSYALIEEGLYNAISDITEEEIFNLNLFKNRKSLTDKRSKLYDFLSSVAALDKDNSNDFLVKVDDLLKIYNQKRKKKTELRKVISEIKSNEILDLKTREEIVKAQELYYTLNGQYLREFFLDVSKLLLTFYNKTPNSAYFKIEGFAASDSEGATVKKSIKQIRSILRICSEDKSNIAKLKSILVDQIIELIHYPEITEKKGKPALDILQGHMFDTQKQGLKNAPYRDNSKDNLVKVLAKHMHIVVSVYPEIKSIFDQQNLISSFVREFIQKSWPSFSSDKSIKEICAEVFANYQELQKESCENHYTKFKEYDEYASSEDEEDKTRFKVSPTPTKATAKVIGAVLSEQQELIELRKYKEIIEKNFEIPKEVKKEIEKECPSLFKTVNRGLFK